MLFRSEVTARFGDFRRAAGLLLPFETVYTFEDRVLLQERVLAVCPDAPGLAEESFRAPERLPGCPG